MVVLGRPRGIRLWLEKADKNVARAEAREEKEMLDIASANKVMVKVARSLSEYVLAKVNHGHFPRFFELVLILFKSQASTIHASLVDRWAAQAKRLFVVE